MQPATSTTSKSGQVKYPTGYQPVQYNGYAPVNYAPIGFHSTTQGPPTAGVNGWTNSINVNRVWGEYMTPVGQIRFGRMPHQWGLGIVANAGDGIDSDYQSTIDRIMFVTGIKSMDLYFGGGGTSPPPARRTRPLTTSTAGSRTTPATSATSTSTSRSSRTGRTRSSRS
jgi:hypothetical protein